MSASAAVPTVRPDPSFRQEVERITGLKIAPCFHCNKCSGGCPVSFAADFAPNRIVRMVQMGMRDAVLRSATIWLCASCETCSTRCPNEVDIAALMDGLRQMARREGVPPAAPEVQLFHEAFLSAVRSRGRVHELGMLARYRMKAGDLFRDAGLGWEMFKRGKLRLLPDGVRDRKAVRAMFKKEN